MHIFNKRWFAACAGAVVLALGSGCALPGPPLPPSLKLPAVVTDLSASRTGDAVTLRWTTPEDTTDKLPIKGPIVAEICRETLAATPTAAVGVKVAVTAPCAPVVGHVSVVPGESEMVDVLPAALASGAAQPLAYRVQLRNAAGHTAGPSAAVYAASGAAPEAIEGLRAKATKVGVVLEWRAEASVPEDAGVGAVELDRVWVDAPATTSGGKAAKSDLGLAAPAKEPVEARLRVEAAEDAGGTTDRGAQIGHTYRYAAQRVRCAAWLRRALLWRCGMFFLLRRLLDWSLCPDLRVRTTQPGKLRSTFPGSRIWTRGWRGTGSIAGSWMARLRRSGGRWGLSL
jgi:hypothetical protein